MIDHPGEWAAFGAALCWTVGSQMVEAAGNRVGAMAVNSLRLVIAVAFLAAWVTIASGTPWPTGFTGEQIGWLAASGFIGLFLGDMCLFRAFIEIGPRLSMLIMSLATPLTAVLGFVFLGEVYLPLQWIGMAVTLGGVAWVIVERRPEHLTARMVDTPRPKRVRNVTPRGIGLALGGMVGQAVGYVMAKEGVGDGDPFAATQIRFAAAIIAFVPLLTVMGYWPRIGRALRDRAAMLFILGGATLGSALGVGLSVAAIKYTTTGVASTILAIVPILLIPFAIVVYREHVSWRAALGAAIAFAGIVLLVADPVTN